MFPLKIPRITTSLTKKKLLQQSQRIFEQGERTGKLLAWLAHEQCQGQLSGTILLDLTPITECFADCYASLYKLKVSYTPAKLPTYLTEIDFPVLTDEYRARLDYPITLEVQTAISSLQPGKTLDGFPVEFYKTYVDELAPCFHTMLVNTFVYRNSWKKRDTKRSQ